MDDFKVADVAVIPIIIGIIQAAKRFFPQASGNVWFALSLALSWGFFVGDRLVRYSWPWLPGTWEEVIVMGLVYGLAAGKAYDETFPPTGRVARLLRRAQ